MLSFTVTLALAASMAEASYRGGYSHGRPAYSQGSQGQHVHAQYYNPHAAPAVEPFVQPHVNTHRYGSHANKTQYDRRYPDAHGNYNHGGLLPKYESPHSHLAHRHTATTDPWGEKQGEYDAADRADWWSPHRQFSPPLVKYVPANLKSSVFTVCNLTPTGGQTGKIEIAQDPHRPASFRADVKHTSTTWAATSAVRFDVYTTGDVPTNDGVLDCLQHGYTFEQDEALGEIFHPLQEKKNGVVNPYADSERGQIADIPRNEADTGVDDTTVQKELLMNLGGADSLIGRAIFVFDIDTTRVTTRGQALDYEPNGDATILGCCIIARAQGPVATTAEPREVWQQSIHTQYHAADPQHEQHTHDAPTYGNNYGNAPAPQRGYGGYGHGRYNSYPQKSYGYGAY